MSSPIPSLPSNGRVGGGEPPSAGGVASNSSVNDRNNNGTPPGVIVRPGAPSTSSTNSSSSSLQPPTTPSMPPSGRRGSHPSSGGSPTSPGPHLRHSDLPPGAAPIGTVPRPPPSNNHSAAMSVPLLASQLGRPVNFGDRGGVRPPGGAPGGAMGAGAAGSLLPHLSPHHLSLISHTLSPFAAIPTGHGRVMARNINGTRKKIILKLPDL